MDELKVLNPHYTVARYPNAANTVPSEAYSKEIASRCLEAAERVVEWVRRNLTTTLLLKGCERTADATPFASSSLPLAVLGMGRPTSEW
jgi:hypothetical protein